MSLESVMIQAPSVAKKYAVVIGINYTTVANARLYGCINDAVNIRSFLTSRAGYLSSNVYMLADNGTNASPTKKNILNAINLLVKKAVMEGFTELWLSYSGHGSYMRDTSMDEKDGRDETICPLDYSRSGFINDDYIYSSLISKLPKSVKLITLFDSCHSGTMSDLPYIYNTSNVLVNENSKMAHQATAMCISGCLDSQTSADAYINGKYAGAMTWSFLKVLADANYNLKCTDLVIRMRSLLSTGGYTQIPLLSLSFSTNLNDYFMKI